MKACLELGNGACRIRSLRYRFLDANFEIVCLSFLLSARRKRLSDWISACLCSDSRFEVEVSDFGGRRIGEKFEGVVEVICRNASLDEKINWKASEKKFFDQPKCLLVKRTLATRLK